MSGRDFQSKEVKEVLSDLEEPTTHPRNRKWNWREPRISLGAFLGLAILAAGGIVLIGHLLYITSSEYRLDITRPGLNDIKQDQLVEVDRNTSYDTTSPVDENAVIKEVQSMNSRQEDLDRYGDFADDELVKMQESLFNTAVTPGSPQE